MGEIHYLISDASKKVDVEAHVLRYWEEELELTIPRNEMGHRYYTDAYIRLFCKVKEMKEKGYQLKAIKSVLPRILESESHVMDKASFIGPMPLELEEEAAVTETVDEPVTEVAAQEESHEVAAEDKMAQFQMIMGNIISQALRENTEILGQEVGNRVSDKVVKEMEYLMRIREEREEERFKKLDETLRTYQKGQKAKSEAAATRLPGFRSKKKKRFGRNGNKLF